MDTQYVKIRRLIQASERLLEMIDLPESEWEDGYDDLAFTGRVNLLREAVEKAYAVPTQSDGEGVGDGR